MATIKYNVSGIERDKDFDVVPAGIYQCKVLSCVDAKPSGKERRLEIVFEVQKKDDGSTDNKGAKLYEYIVLNEASEWKLAQYIRALGLPDSGSLDPKKTVGTIILVKVRVQNDETYGLQARVQRMMPLPEDADVSDGEDLDDEDGAEEEIEEEVEEAEEDGDDEGDDEGDDSAWTEAELKELAVNELTTIASELSLDPKAVIKGKAKAAQKKSALIAAILEAQESAGEDDEDEEESEFWTQEELEELDDDDLRSVMAGDPEDEEDEGLGLDPDDAAYKSAKKVGKKTVKKFDRDKAIAAILEAQSGEDGEDGEEEADEAPDYASMDLDALKALASERGLNTKGSAAILRKRLEKADEPV